MKKFFQFLGFIALCAFSFYYTEKTVSVVKEFDDIMIEIKEVAKSEKIESENATIEGDTIIPGENGQEVDVTKSYQKMRKYGRYDEKLLLMEEFKPKVSIQDHYDKYVIRGNPKKRQVSFLFLVTKEDDITEIQTLANRYHLSFTFFVDSEWLENHNEEVLLLMEEGHTIGNYSRRGDYEDADFAWVDTVIKRIGKQETSYCYTEEKNENTLELCAANKNYTIFPSIIIKEYPYKTIKEQVQAGSLITLPINDQVIEELPSIVKYLESKDYRITNLEQHLSESHDSF